MNDQIILEISVKVIGLTKSTREKSLRFKAQMLGTFWFSDHHLKQPSVRRVETIKHVVFTIGNNFNVDLVVQLRGPEEALLVVEVLVRRLRETRDFPVEVGVGEADLGHVASGCRLAVGKFTAHNLRLGAEVLFLILRIILNGPILLVQRAHVLVVVRVVVIVESVLALSRLVRGPVAMRHQVESAPVEHVADLLGIEALKLLKIDLLQQVELFVR